MGVGCIAHDQPRPLTADLGEPVKAVAARIGKTLVNKGLSRSSHPMPVCNTNKMPCRHSRSGTGRGPGDLSGHGGSNGSINSHNSSSTIHALLTPDRTS
jgi:hypothetical protein